MDLLKNSRTYEWGMKNILNETSGKRRERTLPKYQI